jgi:hypothetical protein
MRGQVVHDLRAKRMPLAWLAASVMLLAAAISATAAAEKEKGKEKGDGGNKF